MPLQIGNQLHAEIADLRGTYDNMKWVEPENYHITLLFLGEQSAGHISAILVLLEQNIPKISAFCATVIGVGQFPPKGPAKVVFAGIREGAVECGVMYDFYRGLLRDFCKTTTRKYMPHITLGRSRPRGKSAILHGNSIPIHAQVFASSAILYESRLSATGAKYIPVQEVFFG